MIGAQKISELTAVSPTGTEYIPCIIPDGLGGWTNGRVLISGMGSNTNLSNTNLTQTDALRTYDIDGNVLQFDNGQVVFGTAIGTDALLETYNTTGGRGVLAASVGSIAVSGGDNTGTGVNGATDSGIGVRGYSSGIGQAFFGESVSGLAALLRGGAYVETYGFGGSAQSSAVFEAASTTKGALIPRMTTTQRDAISSPATGLEIYNTTTNRKEYYNGTYWAGNRQILSVLHGAYNPADSTTAAFGLLYLAPQTSAPLFPAFDFELRGNGVIRACTFNSWSSGTAGSSEAWSLYIRHNSTDYLVATVSSTSAIRVFENTSLNIPYVDGDIVKMIYVNPAWATNPTGVLGQGTITLE